MQDNNLDDFIEILDAVAEQYGKKLSDGLKILYWNGLKEYDFPAVSYALGRCLRNPDTGMFMPKIADIVKMLQGSTQDSALNAWAKVNKAVRSVGVYSTVVFDDPLIHRVIQDMGGWIALGRKKEEEWPFVAKEFENRYRGFKVRNDIPEYLPKLIGVIELQNTEQGYKSEPPTLIGNQAEATKVLKGGSESVIHIGTFKQLTEAVK